MESLDATLSRAWEIFIGDLSDETDAELGDLLPPLVEAGYVEISGESPTGHFWTFTPEGVARAKALDLE
jgi:hypothetical protein